MRAGKVGRWVASSGGPKDEVWAQVSLLLFLLILFSFSLFILARFDFFIFSHIKMVVIK